MRSRARLVVSSIVAAGAAIAGAWGCGVDLAGTGAGDGGTLAEAAAVDGPSGADGAVTTDAGGVGPGSALALEASKNHFVNIASIPIPPDFTLEAWVQPASRGEMVIVAEDLEGENDDQFRLALTADGSLYFAMTDKDGEDYGLPSTLAPTPYTFKSAPLPLDAWSHVAVTKLGSAFTLLVDGITVATQTTTQGDFVRNEAFAFRIGARRGIGGPTSYFDGKVDDVRFYSIARSQGDIAADMRTALTPSSRGYPSLVSYWRFDEASGITATDDTNAFPGELKNGPSRVPSDAF